MDAKYYFIPQCSSKEYTITLKGSPLQLGNEYFVHYIFPNKARKEAKAEAVIEHELLVKDSPGRVFVYSYIKVISTVSGNRAIRMICNIFTSQIKGIHQYA